MKKPKKSQDLKVGPFTLTKGRGERWSLKGVKGVKFTVRPSVFGCDWFWAEIRVGSWNNTCTGTTPLAAARDTLRYAVGGMKGDLKEARQAHAQAARNIERDGRRLEILTTGKVPKGRKP